MASVFAPHHGFLTRMPLTIISLLIKKCVVQAGEFSKVTPSTNTLVHPLILNILGRKKSLICSKSCNFLPLTNLPISFDLEASAAALEGYHVFLSSVNAPPYVCRCLFHSASDSFSFFNGLQYMPFPLIIPDPVIAILV